MHNYKHRFAYIRLFSYYNGTHRYNECFEVRFQGPPPQVDKLKTEKNTFIFIIERYTHTKIR